jgi:hypothetical protein
VLSGRPSGGFYTHTCPNKIFSLISQKIKKKLNKIIKNYTKLEKIKLEKIT